MGCAWFDIKDAAGITTRIDRTDMIRVGGPREFTACYDCCSAEWLTRIRGANSFLPHKCGDPAHDAEARARCLNTNQPEWTHLKRHYNFTLGLTPDLPGYKILFVVPEPERLIRHGAVSGFMIWRKRLSMYQTVMCTPDQLKDQDLNRYDAVLMTVHGNTPILTGVKPKVILYAHDHHHAATVARVPKLLAAKPAAIFTPYPSIWLSAYPIPKQTRVCFAPYLTDPMWSIMRTNFSERPLDVLVIGTYGHVYPERIAIVKTMDGKKFPFSFRLWGAPEPEDQPECKSAYSYVAPVMTRWSTFLSEARICVFGMDAWGYLVSKYAEILAATSLMVAPAIPDCDNLGLVAGRHYVPLARPVETALVPQLTELAKNFRKYKQIALNGLEWFKTYAEKVLYENFWRDMAEVIGGK